MSEESMDIKLRFGTTIIPADKGEFTSLGTKKKHFWYAETTLNNKGWTVTGVGNTQQEAIEDAKSEIKRLDEKILRI